MILKILRRIYLRSRSRRCLGSLRAMAEKSEKYSFVELQVDKLEDSEQNMSEKSEYEVAVYSPGHEQVGEGSFGSLAERNSEATEQHTSEAQGMPESESE